MDLVDERQIHVESELRLDILVQYDVDDQRIGHVFEVAEDRLQVVVLRMLLVIIDLLFISDLDHDCLIIMQAGDELIDGDSLLPLILDEVQYYVGVLIVVLDMRLVYQQRLDHLILSLHLLEYVLWILIGVKLVIQLVVFSVHLLVLLFVHSQQIPIEYLVVRSCLKTVLIKISLR